MSRYLIRKRLAHSEEGAPPFKEEKCSGLLCATGAGSTGWFKSCLPVEERNHAVFSRSAPFFEYLAREALQPMPPARVQSDEALEIISEMDGEIVADSDHELSFSFPYGARAILKLAGERLSHRSQAYKMGARFAHVRLGRENQTDLSDPEQRLRSSICISSKTKRIFRAGQTDSEEFRLFFSRRSKICFFRKLQMHCLTWRRQSFCIRKQIR